VHFFTNIYNNIEVCFRFSSFLRIVPFAQKAESKLESQELPIQRGMNLLSKMQIGDNKISSSSKVRFYSEIPDREKKIKEIKKNKII